MLTFVEIGGKVKIKKQYREEFDRLQISPWEFNWKDSVYAFIREYGEELLSHTIPHKSGTYYDPDTKEAKQITTADEGGLNKETGIWIFAGRSLDNTNITEKFIITVLVEIVETVHHLSLSYDQWKEEKSNPCMFMAFDPTSTYILPYYMLYDRNEEAEKPQQIKVPIGGIV